MSLIALPKDTTGLRQLGHLQDIPAVRQLGLFALVAATIAFGLWLFFWTQRPDYVPIHAGLDPRSTSEAGELLRAAQVPFRLDPASGALAVPADSVGAARIALAEAGLPAGDGAGFESMQGDQGFGTSQFLENARYQHAQEIELARTIANLRPVAEARVHLAVPKPSAFTRASEPASASVVLQLRSGSTLEQGQVNAIVHLVASSVPGLPPERVTVVDQFGRMLSTHDADDADTDGSRRFELQRRREAAYVQRIQELLEPMVGRGRVSAQVSVDMDFAQTEEAREQYGPQPAVVRSEQVSESGELGSTGSVAQGVPGSASNTPAEPGTGAAEAAAPATADPGAPSGGTGSRTAVRNYEIDRTLTHVRQAPGQVRRVTAAVLVDHIETAPAADGDAPASRALDEAEIGRIETLVKQAIGFDAERGDAVSVVNAPFARGPTDIAGESGPPFWQHPRVRELARLSFGGLAVLLLIFTVLRPAFRQLLAPKARPGTLPTAEPATVIATDTESPAPAPAQVAGPPQATTATLGFEEKLEVARSAVTTDPKRVAQVVRDMVQSDG